MRLATFAALVAVVIAFTVVSAHEVREEENDVHGHEIRRLHRATLARAVNLRRKLRKLQKEGRGHEFARVPVNFLQMGASVREDTKFIGSLTLLDKIIAGLVSSAFKLTTSIVIGVVTYEGMETVNKIAIQKFMLLIFQLAVVVIESLLEFSPVTLLSAIPVLALYGAELIITMRIGMFIKKGLDTITSTCIDLEPLRIDAVDSRHDLEVLRSELEAIELKQHALSAELSRSSVADEEEEEKRLDEMHDEVLKSFKSMQKVADDAATKYKDLSNKILNSLSKWKNKVNTYIHYKEYRIFKAKYNIVFWIMDWFYRLGQKVTNWLTLGWQKMTGAAKEQLRETRAKAKLPVSEQLRPEEEFFKTHTDAMKMYIDQVVNALKHDQLLESDNAMEGIPTEFIGHVYDTAYTNKADLAYVYADKQVITVGRTAFRLDIDEAQDALVIGNRADAMHKYPKIKNSLLLRCALRMSIPLAVMLKKANMKFGTVVRHHVGEKNRRQCNYLLQNAFNIRLNTEGGKPSYSVSVSEKKAKYCVSWGFWRSKKQYEEFKCNVPWRKKQEGFSWCVDSAEEVVSWTCALITALEYTKDPTLLSTTFLSTRANPGLSYGSPNVFQQNYIPVKEVYSALCKKPDDVSPIVTTDLVEEAQTLKARLEKLKKKNAESMVSLPTDGDSVMDNEVKRALEETQDDDRQTLAELEANEFDPLENIMESIVSERPLLTSAKTIAAKHNMGLEATKTSVPFVLPGDRPVTRESNLQPITEDSAEKDD